MDNEQQRMHFDDGDWPPGLIEELIARGISHIVTDPKTGEEVVEFVPEARRVAERFNREVDDVRVVHVSQDVLDRYYHALEPDDKGLMGVLGIDVDEDGVVVRLHPDASWKYAKIRLVCEGVLWPDEGGTWNGDAVWDSYDSRKTVGGDWRGYAWAKLLGDVVCRRDAEGREREVLADKPLTELSPLGQFFKRNFWPWDVAALAALIRRAWPGRLLRSGMR